MMKRRDFCKVLGLSALSWQAPGQAPDEATPTLYYVDGYHGGSRGHMPAGSWRDILNAMRAFPDWKISLDIEAVSWDDLRREDPEAYHEIQKLLADQQVAARVEICNGMFVQPFGWANGGESTVRQLLRGREIIREHFPHAVIETYAVQEPCWSSCLPQLLRSLGFTAASLKNPGTAWGGYSAGFDAETVEWVGPDGTAIPTVPRYACEELLQTWETESVRGTAAFARKCLAHGIAHPAGNCFQDLGWSARPKVTGNYIRYVTLREYMKQIAVKPEKQWKLSPEDILTTLPWGEKTLQTVAQQVRSAENRVLVAEKMASMSAALLGSSFPSAALQRAWDQLLWAQHHDAWITATTRAGRQAWAFQVAAETMETEEIANTVIGDAARALCRGDAAVSSGRLGPQWIRVFNTTATEREDIVELSWASDVGTKSARVFDSEGRQIPCQFSRPRRFSPRGNPTQGGRGASDPNSAGLPAYGPGESLNAATVTFRAKTPSLGHAPYRIEPVYDESPATAFSGASARHEADGAVVLETDLYRVQLDPKRGGVITSLLVKSSGREVVDNSAERVFNEYRGYFISEQKWASSADSPANVTVIEGGPVRVRAQISGQILGRRFQSTISLAQGQRRIDCTARFTYDADTWIGDPWDITPENRRTERRRSPHDGRWKLQAFFPTPLRNQAIYKNSGYDVCRSRNRDTFFQRWDEIKHNIVLHWVDLLDEQQKLGLAVLSDHTTGYTHGPDHPLALVMGWGWEGGFWWGKCPLRGTQQVSYALIPHAGTWDEAGISRESCCWNEPLTAQIIDGHAGSPTAAHSLVTVSGEGIEIPTVLIQGRAMLIRLFNAAGDDAERTVSLGTRPARVELVELDGRASRQLAIRAGSVGRSEVRLAMPRFGIRTLRCQLDPAIA